MGIIRFETGVLATLFLGLFILEWVFPLRRRVGDSLKRIAINAFMSGLAVLTGYFTVRASAQAVSGWSSEVDFGLLNVVTLPLWLQFVAGFLLMDLTFYYWHRMNHVVPLLWRFHNIHHLDPDLDVTTSFRFHFLEILYSVAFRVVQVGLIGVTMPIYAAYELLFQCGTMFHHSNLRLPIRLERLINKIIVTPRMHGIHHSVVKSETNSNYSVVFRWWDALHRTLRLAVPQAAIRIGVAGYQEPADNQPGKLIAAPLQKQKDYWHFPDGSEPSRTVPVDPGGGQRLAE